MKKKVEKRERSGMTRGKRGNVKCNIFREGLWN